MVQLSLRRIVLAGLILISLIVYHTYSRKISTSELREQNTEFLEEIQLNSLSKLKATQLFESFSYIPLETTEESIIGEISKLTYYNSKYYVLDKKFAKAVFIFDSGGHYLDKIIDIGSGPNQYLDIADFSIEQDTLYLLSKPQGSIIMYDLNGEQLGKIKQGFPISQFEKINDEFILHFNNSNSDKNQGNIGVSKFVNGHLDSLVEYLEIPKNLENSQIQSEKLIHKHASNIYIIEIFNDTIYYYNDKNLFSKFTFSINNTKIERKKLEKYKKDLGLILKNNEETLFIKYNKVLFNDNWIYLEAMVGLNYYNIFYNPISKVKFCTPSITYNLNENLFSPPIASYQNYFIAVLDQKLLNYFKNLNKSIITNEDLQTIHENYKEDDNPILVRYKLKSDFMQ